MNRIFAVLISALIFSSSITSQEKDLVLAVVKKNNMYGIIEQTGKWYIENTYEYIGEISEGYVHAVSRLNYDEGFIHIASKTFIPFSRWKAGKNIEGYDNLSVYDYTVLYTDIQNPGELSCSMKNNTDTISVDTSVADTLYKPNYTFVENIAPVWIGPMGNLKYEYDNGKWGYINVNGKWIVKPISDVGRIVNEGYMLIAGNDTASLVDSNFVSLSERVYNSAYSFSEGMACVGIGDSISVYADNLQFVDVGSWGFLNLYGEECIELVYEIAFPFSDNYAAVSKNNKFGFINKSGKLVIPCIFDEGKNFSNGRAGAMINNHWGVIDKNGEWIIEPVFSEILEYSHNMAVARDKESYGYIDLNGNWAIQPSFEHAGSFKKAANKNCIDCLRPVKILDSSSDTEKDSIKVNFNIRF